MPKRKISVVDANLGRNLAFYRAMAGLTQQQVADKLNLNRTTYTKYETGASEPSIESLKKLADIFEISVDMLFADSTPPAIASDVDYHEKDYLVFRGKYEQLTDEQKELFDSLFKRVDDE